MVRGMAVVAQVDGGRRDTESKPAEAYFDNRSLTRR